MPAPPEFARPAAARQVHPPLRLRPSSQSFAGTVRVAETVKLGARITLVGDADLQAVGEAFHRFFASDDPALSVSTRLAQAGAMLRRWAAPQVAPGDLVKSTDRLHAFLDQRYGEAARLREWPVHAAEELQVISGRIDLLVDAGGGFAVIDHKSFPGVMDLDDGRLRAFAGQVDDTFVFCLPGSTGACRDGWDLVLSQELDSRYRPCSLAGQIPRLRHLCA